jgi:excisionase family DNA binding protein
MQQCKRWTCARLAVRYTSAVVVVVEPKSGRRWQGHILAPVRVPVIGSLDLPLPRQGCAIAAHRFVILAMTSEMPNMDQMRNSPLGLSTSQAANALGVSLGTVRRWADMGYLDSYRTPGGQRRFSVEQIEQFLETLQQRRTGQHQERLVS